MLGYVLRRLANIVVVLFGLTLFVFLLLRLAPGSPVNLLAGEMATQEDIRALERQFGLDKPLPVQYANFLEDLLRGDLGESIVFLSSAADLVLERLPATIELTLCATLLTVVVAIPLGLLIAIKRHSWIDYAGTIFTMSGVSVPAFWLGIMLILLFAVQLDWVPTSGRGEPIWSAVATAFSGNLQPLGESLRHLALPTITLSAFQMAFLSRMTRSSILEELGANYVRAARARGLPYPLVLTKHALRNAILPVITVLGLEIGSLIGGAVITEAVFAWPGVGQLLYRAVSGRDYPLAQAGILIVGAFVTLITLLVDLSYGLIDPRIRYS